MPILRLVQAEGHGWRVDSSPPDGISPLGPAQVDLYSIANGLFGCETLVREGKAVDRIEVPCLLEYDTSVPQWMEDALEFIIGHSIQVKLIKGKKDLQTSLIAEGETAPFSEGCTCLFSTGLDSYSALLNSARKYPGVTPCYVDHEDFHKLRGLHNRFSRHIHDRYGLATERIRAPAHRSHMMRSRGMLYVLCGLLLGNKRLIVGEAGATIYQPKLTLLDLVTVTTHPTLMKIAGEIAKGTLGVMPTIIRPCEDMTKAEVAASCPDKEWIRKTFSCSATTRFATEEGVANCGTCFACIVRRLAVLVAGDVDCHYAFDVGAQRVSMRARDNLIQLLRFSIDFLSDKEAIPWYSREIVTEYRKADLFERFALDNLAGLKLLCEKGETNQAVAKIRELSQKRVDDSVLQERIQAVRSNRMKMNFDNRL